MGGVRCRAIRTSGSRRGVSRISSCTPSLRLSQHRSVHSPCSKCGRTSNTVANTVANHLGMRTQAFGTSRHRIDRRHLSALPAPATATATAPAPAPAPAPETATVTATATATLNMDCGLWAVPAAAAGTDRPSNGIAMQRARIILPLAFLVRANDTGAMTSRPRHCLCLVCFHCPRGQDTAFAVCVSTAFVARHCLCRVCFHCLRG